MMNLEKYTERARGFVQSAQSLALREGHQQFTPEHVLKVLLDDEEGLAAGLIDRAGGNSRQALDGRSKPPSPNCRRSRDRAPASSIWRRRRLACSTTPRRSPRRRATRSSPSSACLLALAMEKGTQAAKILANAGVSAQTLNAAINDLRKGRTADFGKRREPV